MGIAVGAVWENGWELEFSGLTLMGNTTENQCHEGFEWRTSEFGSANRRLQIQWLVLMKKVAFSQRDRWWYGGALVALLVGIALLLSGRERLGQSLAVAAFSFAIAFGIGRGHVAESGGYEHSEQEDKRPD